MRNVDTLTSTRRTVPAGYRRDSALPWRLRMGLRMLGARLPGGLSRLLPASLLDDSHDMEQLGDLFETKLSLYRSLVGRRPRSFLELGPGETAARALIAAAHGIERCWLVDAQDFARRDMRHYHAIAAELTARGLVTPDIGHCRTRQDVLFAAGASYLTEGLSSLRLVPDRSVDLIVSEAVLEHLPRAQFDAFMAEFARILSPGGIGLHGIDLHDHTGGGLDSLRVGAERWESGLFRRSGFYTNRLSRSQILSAAARAGLRAAEFYRLEWPTPPLARQEVHRDVGGWTEEDLLVCSFGLAIQLGDAERDDSRHIGQHTASAKADELAAAENALRARDRKR